jgi:uncharacterized iron-regulated membrane protein
LDLSTTPLPSITIRASATAPVQLSFGRERTIFIDPADGKILGGGSNGVRAFFTRVETIHRALGGELRNSLGRHVTGICNLAFLFLVASGFYLWFPKKYSWQHFRLGLWFKGDLKARGRDLNWHKVVGFWSAIPLFFIVLTGVIMSYAWATNMLYRMTGTEPPPPQSSLRSAGTRGHSGKHQNPVQPVKSLDELLAIVKGRMPGWRSITFRIPEERDRSITFSTDEGNGGQPQKRLQLTLSRTTGEIQRQEGFATYNSGRKLRTVARFLHTGEIFGFVGQLIAAVASLGGAFLVCTGLALAIRRVTRWYRRGAGTGRIGQTEEQRTEVLSS